MLTRSFTLVILLTGCVAVSLDAQAPAKKAVAPTSTSSDVRVLWMRSTDYLQRSAEAMPDSTYSFRPTSSVRTFGEIIGHIAGSQEMYCAVALGETPPPEDAIEKAATSKSALVNALEASSRHCIRAYAQSDAALSAMTSAMGTSQSRRSVLLLNLTHNYEHYGNVITYLRMNGMVPPSSQPSQ